MKKFTSDTQKTGKIGEDIACRYIVSKGFSIYSRNYTKSVGEIDIVATKPKKLYFFEVKSISRLPDYIQAGETDLKNTEYIRPEENMTRDKMQKLSRVTSFFFQEHPEFKGFDFSWNLIAIEMDPESKKAKVRMIENINLS